MYFRLYKCMHVYHISKQLHWGLGGVDKKKRKKILMTERFFIGFIPANLTMHDRITKHLKNLICFCAFQEGG